MARVNDARRLIVNADDFGVSESVNQAVRRAHEQGILTSASLMVGGDAFSQAVDIARQCPRLGVGLHLTLVRGRSVLPASALPGLVRRDGTFDDDPVRAGWRYFRRKSLRDPLEWETIAQLERFHATGLPLDHVNGHLHFHLHPVILDILLRRTDGHVPLRLTRDRFWLNARLAEGRWLDRVFHALVFHGLARRTEPLLRLAGRRFTPVVFGLLQNGSVNETFVARLLPRLPAGDSELYSHPSLDNGKEEWRALVSPEVREMVRRQNIRLIRYADL